MFAALSCSAAHDSQTTQILHVFHCNDSLVSSLWYIIPPALPPLYTPIPCPSPQKPFPFSPFSPITTALPLPSPFPSLFVRIRLNQTINTPLTTLYHPVLRIRAMSLYWVFCRILAECERKEGAEVDVAGWTCVSYKVSVTHLVRPAKSDGLHVKVCLRKSILVEKVNVE